MNERVWKSEPPGSVNDCIRRERILHGFVSNLVSPVGNRKLGAGL